MINLPLKGKRKARIQLRNSYVISEASAWYRNAFMNSFLVAEEKKDKAPSSIVPRVEETYGTFVVTADLDEIAQPVAPNATTPEAASTVNNSTAGAAQ